MGTVYAIANQKGGVGKTTTAVNVGACIAEAGYTTLLVDVDPQANATIAPGIRRTRRPALYEVRPGEAIALVRRELNPQLTVCGMLLTMHDSRTRLGQDVEREVREHFADLVFTTVIPRNVRVGEAPSYGLPVTHHDPNSVGAEAYFEL